MVESKGESKQFDFTDPNVASTPKKYFKANLSSNTGKYPLHTHFMLINTTVNF